MTNKQIIGLVILTASVGALFYVYNGFLKPRLEVDALVKEGKIPFPSTTQQQTKTT